jgi:hypothetical protein
MEALELAKRELRFLVVYLHSEQHDDTDEFCKNMLCASEFRRVLADHRVLVWGGNIKEEEAFKGISNDVFKLGSERCAPSYELSFSWCGGTATATSISKFAHDVHRPHRRHHTT